MVWFVFIKVCLLNGSVKLEILPFYLTFPLDVLKKVYGDVKESGE